MSSLRHGGSAEWGHRPADDRTPGSDTVSREKPVDGAAGPRLAGVHSLC